MCVPYTGSQAWTRSVGYKVVDEWRPWFFDEQVAGYVFTFYQYIRNVFISEEEICSEFHRNKDIFLLSLFHTIWKSFTYWLQVCTRVWEQPHFPYCKGLYTKTYLWFSLFELFILILSCGCRVLGILYQNTSQERHWLFIADGWQEDRYEGHLFEGTLGTSILMSSVVVAHEYG